MSPFLVSMDSPSTIKNESPAITKLLDLEIDSSILAFCWYLMERGIWLWNLLRPKVYSAPGYSAPVHTIYSAPYHNKDYSAPIPNLLRPIE